MNDENNQINNNDNNVYNPQNAQNTEQPEPTTVPNRINPVLLLFLIFPIIGIIAALLTSRPAGNSTVGTLVPPPAYFTSTTKLGSPAPDFVLQNLSRQPVRLSNLRGQWVFLNFWATWCGPCRREMPTFQALMDGGFGDYSGKVTVLAVNRVETVDKVAPFMEELKLTLPVVLDSDATVSNLYGVLNLPVTFLIDPNGVVRYQQYGEVTPDLIKLYLEEIGDPVTDEF